MAAVSASVPHPVMGRVYEVVYFTSESKEYTQLVVPRNTSPDGKTVTCFALRTASPTDEIRPARLSKGKDRNDQLWLQTNTVNPTLRCRNLVIRHTSAAIDIDKVVYVVVEGDRNALLTVNTSELSPFPSPGNILQFDKTLMQRLGVGN